MQIACTNGEAAKQNAMAAKTPVGSEIRRIWCRKKAIEMAGGLFFCSLENFRRHKLFSKINLAGGADRRACYR